MKSYIKLILLFSFLIQIQGQSDSLNISKLYKIGEDEPLEEILRMNWCDSPVFVNGKPDSLLVEGQLFPDPCAPSQLNNFIFYLPQDFKSKVYLYDVSEKTKYYVIRNILERGYYKLSFTRFYKEKRLPFFYNIYGSNPNINVIFEINDKKYSFKLIRTNYGSN